VKSNLDFFLSDLLKKFVWSLVKEISVLDQKL